MNKFKNIVEKLIKVKLWKSSITLTQKVQRKSENGKVIYVPEFSKEVNCVKKDLSKITQNALFDYDTEFIVASNELKEFNLNDGHFTIIYNNRKYEVKDLLFQGTLNNEDCLVSFYTKR